VVSWFTSTPARLISERRTAVLQSGIFPSYCSVNTSSLAPVGLPWLLLRLLFGTGVKTPDGQYGPGCSSSPHVPESSPSLTGLYLNSFASTLGSPIENKALSKECQPWITRPATSRLRARLSLDLTHPVGLSVFRTFVRQELFRVSFKPLPASYQITLLGPRRNGACMLLNA